MTGEVAASAPGKLVLSGEYAVLDGAPAICMALDRRAYAVLADIDSDYSVVTAPGFTTTVGRFDTRDGDMHWHDGRQSFAVVDAVWRAAAAMAMDTRAIRLDTVAFFDVATQQKIGIGSSAAITVALCAAVVNSADVAALTTVVQHAHRALQGGAGSGLDIACSLAGGLIEYRMADTSVAALTWPAELSYRVLWSGVAASTRDKLSQLAAAISKPSRAQLVATAHNVAQAWRSADASRIIAAYPEYCEHLQQFSNDHGLGIFAAGHDRLWRAAAAAGLIYKPCGAGGGDIGILLGMDDAELDAFTAAQSACCAVLDCALSATGVRIDA